MARARYGFRLLRQLLGFARENRAYWLIPLLLLLALAAAVIVTGQGAAPLIYTLF